jgi:glycosyltransferase involved in cell wall biosynthesis
MVGRMIAAKGVDTLLKAADILLKTGSFLFLIAGDGPDREDFTSMADTLGLRQSVRFLGYRQDIPTLLKAADLFVLPSLSEGLPLSVLEAMAAKRAIVATRVGGIPDLVEDGITGLLVNPGDAVALAEAINALAIDPDRRISMGMAGRLRVEEHFTETRMLNELSGVYLSAIADLNYGPCLGSQIIH